MSNINVKDFAHYATRYQLSKDSPEFLQWWIEQLTFKQAKALLLAIAIDVNHEELSKYELI